MNATTKSTSANPEQLIADLRRQLAERAAELAEAQRNLNETMTERDEALAREVATAEVLGVINSSPGDLAPVFDNMLEKATRLCESNFGILFTCEDQRFRVAALYGVPEAYAAYLTREPIKPAPQTALAGRLPTRAGWLGSGAVSCRCGRATGETKL